METLTTINTSRNLVKLQDVLIDYTLSCEDHVFKLCEPKTWCTYACLIVNMRPNENFNYHTVWILFPWIDVWQCKAK